MKNYRESQIYNAMREERQLLFSNVTREQFHELARTKQIPPYSIHLWAAEAIYGPKGSARSVTSDDERLRNNAHLDKTTNA